MRNSICNGGSKKHLSDWWYTLGWSLHLHVGPVVVVVVSLCLHVSRAGDVQASVAVNLHFFLLRSVEDLQDVLGNGVLVLFPASGLQKDLDIAKLAEVEVTLLLQSGVLKLQLINLLDKLAASAAPASDRGRSWLFAGLRGNTTAASNVGGTPLVASFNFASVLRHRVHFVSTSNVVEILVLAAARAVVGLAVVVLVEKGLDPLAELQVVLVLGVFQFANVNMALDAVLVKSSLQNLVVLDKFVLVLCLPLDTAKGERVGVQAVHNCAVNRTSSALFNLLHTQLQRVERTKANLPREAR